MKLEKKMKRGQYAKAVKYLKYYTLQLSSMRFVNSNKDLLERK